MLKLISLDDYQLITSKKKWFNGRIYIDKRVKVSPFQLAILEKFIAQIIANSNQDQTIKLDFHLLVTGDNTGNEFSVDLFVFIEAMVVNIQNIFNNYFSALHWGLDSIFQAVSKLSDGLISRHFIDEHNNGLTIEELSQCLLEPNNPDDTETKQ